MERPAPVEKLSRRERGESALVLIEELESRITKLDHKGTIETWFDEDEDGETENFILGDLEFEVRHSDAEFLRTKTMVRKVDVWSLDARGRRLQGSSAVTLILRAKFNDDGVKSGNIMFRDDQTYKNTPQAVDKARRLINSLS